MPIADHAVFQYDRLKPLCSLVTPHRNWFTKKFRVVKKGILAKIGKNISTDGEVVPKIKVAPFFLDAVYI